ncbi:MAG: hypothetical protein JOZ92_04745 [Candidatus Dormibacteraeota bacterium]|nr:hypothetical protein [Candidatus Dormibacteraeota bacterium]
MAAIPSATAGSEPSPAMTPGSAPVAGVGTSVLAPWTLVFGVGDGDVQPVVNAQIGSGTLVGDGVLSGGGVEAGDAAIVSTAAGTARAVMPNFCQFTSLPPDAGFAGRAYLAVLVSATWCGGPAGAPAADR